MYTVIQTTFFSLCMAWSINTWASETTQHKTVRHTAVKIGVYEFSYDYPQEAHAIPKLSAYLRKQAVSKKRRLIADATPKYWRLKRNQSPHGDQDITTWTLAANTDKLLVLDGQFKSYLGGAHGDYSSDSLYWDKQRKRRIQFEDIFISRESFQHALQSQFCAALDAQRLEKRSGDTVRKEYMECLPLMAGITTIPSSSQHGRSIDQIFFRLDPYMAGPFGEGEYLITLKVTPALLEAIKPIWRSEFTLGQ
jgi:hypothetical protein